MIVCHLCFGEGRDNVPATEPHPAGRPGWLCHRHAQDVHDALEAFWGHLAETEDTA